MINNLGSIFSEYQNNFQQQKSLEIQILTFLKNELVLEFLPKNLKLDLSKKEIKLINLNSNYRFILQQKLTPEFLEKFKNKFNLTLKV